MGLIGSNLENIIDNNKNKYFNFNNTKMDLNKILPGMINESIGMFGIEVMYIKVEIIKNDINHVLGELKKKNYNEAFKMRVGSTNKETFDGDSEVFNRQGFSNKDEGTIYIGKLQLISIIGREPIMGDLVFHESSTKLFKVIGVDTEEDMFYIGGISHQYKLYLYEYVKGEGDRFSTNDIIIDSVNNIKDVSIYKNEDNEVDNLIDNEEESPFSL